MKKEMFTLKVIAMKKFTILLCILWAALGYAQEKQIKGFINDGKNPLADVEVKIKNETSGTFTDVDGTYKIFANEGDVLVFSYTGMGTQEIMVEDVTKVLNISMFPDVKELAEVVVEKTRIKSQTELSQAYATNENLIQTAFGILDKDITSFAVRIITKDQLNLAGVDLASVLQNKFPGIRVDRSGSDPLSPTIFLRGGGIGFFPAIYDVDGLVLTEIPDFIRPENIERVAILSGLGLVTKYGGKANGGVIVINTKGANYYRSATGEYTDQALLRNNTYVNDIADATSLNKSKPTYLQSLEASTNFNAAKDSYETSREVYKSSPYFVLDAYTYFKSNWKKNDFSNAIIDDHQYLFADNPVLLKALAYTYQEQGDFKRANETLKEVFVLRSHYPQSYLDLANSYRDMGNYKRAAAMYARYEYLVKENFIKIADSDFNFIMDREYSNLINIRRDKLINGVTFTGSILEEEFSGTRLVFEWNDSEAEFDLQFINPENKYYTWNHSLELSKKRIIDEKTNRYSSSEYLIDNSLAGNWKVNVKYKGNKSLTPTYLKTTVYYNYGKVSQRKEVRLHKLSTKDVNQQIISLVNSGAVGN